MAKFVVAVVLSAWGVCGLQLENRSSNAAIETRKFVTNSRLVLGTEQNYSASVRAGDFDGDLRVDITIANGRHWPQQNYVVFNKGNAAFAIVRPLGTDRSRSYACEPGDLDGDGDLDLISGNELGPCHVFLNDGDGKFQQGGSLEINSSVRSLTLYDMDRDGDLDVLVTCRNQANRIFLNDGNAKFGNPIKFGSGRDSTIDVAAGDLNQDGFPDLVLANRDSQQNEVLLNDGKLDFSKSKPFGANDDQSRSLVLRDFNSDGILDCAVANIGAKNSLYHGNGQGGFVLAKRFGANHGRTYSLIAADFNNDGLVDLATGNVRSKNAVFFNCGPEEMFESTMFGLESSDTYGICAADFNGDGFLDIATANSGSTNRVFLNVVDRNSITKKTDAPVKIEVENSSDWPQFRGRGSTGVNHKKLLPVQWSANSDSINFKNVLWQTAIPGLAHSSPVVAGNKVFVTTAISTSGDSPLMLGKGGAPTAANDSEEQKWIVFCWDKTTGKELWQQVARQGKPRATRHAKATHANSSICVSGDNVIAFFGSEGLYCYDLDGNLKWSRDLGVIDISKYGIGWGYASSPVVGDDSIVLICDDPKNPRLIVLNLNDGSDKFEISRKGVSERNWSSPLIVAGDSNNQVVVNGWPVVVSYDLTSGRELWRIEGGGDNPVPTPFVHDGWIYVTSAHGSMSPIYVVNPNARGNITPNFEYGEIVGRDSPENADSKPTILWSRRKGGSYMSTPVVVGENIFLGNSNGIIRCFNAKTGEKMYEKRLSTSGIIASLVSDGKNVFCLAENGDVFVVEAGDEFNLISTNKFGEPVFASPAISEGVVYFRTTKRLIAISMLDPKSRSD